MLKRGQNRKRCVFFSTSIQLPRGFNSYFANQRGWTAVVCLFVTNEKKKTPKNRQLLRLSGSQFSRG